MQCFWLYVGNQKVDRLEEVIRKINRNTNVKARFFRFVEPIAYKLGPDIIVDATNNPISKAEVLKYSTSYCIPYISVSSNESMGIISIYNDKQEYERIRRAIGNIANQIRLQDYQTPPIALSLVLRLVS